MESCAIENHFNPFLINADSVDSIIGTTSINSQWVSLKDEMSIELENPLVMWGIEKCLDIGKLPTSKNEGEASFFKWRQWHGWPFRKSSNIKSYLQPKTKIGGCLAKIGFHM